MQAEWRGLDFVTILKFAIAYEFFYRVTQFALLSNPSQKLRTQGNSYMCAFINAIIMSYAGLACTYELWSAPEESKAFISNDPSEQFYLETNRVRDAASPFIAWITFDLIHVILNFPKLGSYDQLFHHSMFLLLSCVACGFGLCPFAGSWLFCGELSSIPLNIRWLLINTGYGSTSWMTAVNVAFSVTFFIVRVLLYWYGLFGFLFTTVPTMKANGTSKQAVNVVALFLTAGAILNAYWFVLIVRMATGIKKQSKPKSDESAELTAIAGATSPRKPKSA